MEKHGVVVLNVHLGDPTEEILKTYQDMGLPYPVLVDGGAEVKGKYGVDASPTVLVAGADGKIALRTLWHEEAVEQEVKILTGLMKPEDRKVFARKGTG
jgi:hypothetical protein